jgi:hypothetical protein
MAIVVIGTDPPCVRCHTTFKRAKEVAQQYPGKVEVGKLAIHTKEAEQYGKVEAGHGISQSGNVKQDFEKMKNVLGEINALMADEDKYENAIDLK